MRYPTLHERGFVMPRQTAHESAFTGASHGRRTKTWTTSSAGPHSVVVSNINSLRKRSRALVRNDPYGGAALDRWVSNVIGSGIRPQPIVKEESLREQITELWEEWTEQADADGMTNYYGIQALAERAASEGGDCFIRFRRRRPGDGMAVPLQLQVLEAEMCPEYEERMASARRAIIGGVEFDRLGRRTGYWFHRRHPGEAPVRPREIGDLVRLPASEIIHLYQVHRPGQVRGIPRLTRAVLRLWGLDKYDDATLLRQEIAALFAAFVIRPQDEEPTADPIDPITGEKLERDDDGGLMAKLEAGTMWQMEPGEDVRFSDPPDTGSGYKDFMRQQLLAICAAVGVPYESVTGDLSNVNDRTIRAVLQEFRRAVRAYQQQVFVHVVCQRVWREWFDTAVLAGALRVRNYDTRRLKVQKVRHQPEPWPHLHPVQDVQANRESVAGGFDSLDRIREERGLNPVEVDRQNAEAKKRADDHGLSYTSLNGGGSASAARPTGGETPEEPPGPGREPADDEEDRPNAQPQP